MHVFSLFNRRQNKQSASNDKVQSPRRATFETLEDRSMLSASPDCSSLSASASSSDSGYYASLNEDNQQLQESYDIEYKLLEEGRVRVLGQTGIQYLSTYTYCAPQDDVYLTLWTKALACWEEVIVSGAPDVVYPYDVDGETGLEIDDLYLYFGFSDSFFSSTSLGSSLNAGYYRNDGLGLAATGSLVFNAKYFTESPSETVQQVFYNTALHELAHALGYNLTHLEDLNLLERSVSTPYGLDDVFETSSGYWYYIGEKGVEQYSLAFPDSIQTLSTSNGFLMETYTANGSYAAHPSSLLGTYYLYLNQRDGMNYAISPSFKATITATTLGVFEDLGYSVDYDFADSFDSPTPIDVQAVVKGSSVQLSWSKSLGDFSASVQQQVYYSIQRCDLLESIASMEDTRTWETIAEGLTEPEYQDLNLTPGKEYLYRVIASNVRTNSEIGVFTASVGDTLTWDDVASKYCVYALTNKGSNALTWTRVVSSTTETSWTVTTLSQTPVDGTTIYRVVAIGTTLDETKPSKAIDVSISTGASKYVPEGYSKEDWRSLRQFLEITDSSGIKNGEKINGASYSPDFLETIPGVVWEIVDGEYRLTQISWPNKNLVGSLDLSKCTELTSLDASNNQLEEVKLSGKVLLSLNVANNAISSLSLSNLSALETLLCNNNNIQQLDLDTCVNLKELDCSQNQLSSLSTSAGTKLETLRCSTNPIESLDLSANARLSLVEIWNQALVQVALPSTFSGSIDVGEATADSYSWIRNDRSIGDSSVWTGECDSFNIELTMTFEESTQFVILYSGSSEYIPQTPSNFVFGMYEAGKLQTSWTDESDNETGFKVLYRVDNGSWAQAADLRSSLFVTVTTGTAIERQATKLKSGHVYSFRVYAYKTLSTGDVIYSSPLEASYALPSDLSDVKLESEPVILVGREVSLNVGFVTADCSYQWYRVDALGSAAPIQGATTVSYVPTSNDLGYYLRGAVTYDGQTYSATANAIVANASLDTPENLEFGAYSQGRVPMSWTDESTSESGYQVFYRIEGSDWKLAETIESSQQRSSSSGNLVVRMASGVHEQDSYSFAVVAYAVDGGGTYAYSVPLVANYSLQATLNVPENLVLSDYDSETETLKLSWDQVNDAIYYETQYSVDSVNWITSEVTVDSQRTARSVRQDRIYYFRVRALGLNGATSEWTYASFPTEILQTPSEFTAFNYDVTTKTLSLRWNAVEGATSYIVEYRRAENESELNETAWAISEQLDDVSRVARNVLPGMYYQFRIRALNDDERVFSDWNTLAFATTDVWDGCEAFEPTFIQDLFDEIDRSNN